MAYRKRIALLLLPIGTLALFCGLLSPRIPIRTDYIFTCGRCRSQKSYQRWPFGIETHARFTRSLLQELAEELGKPIDHQWVCTAGTARNIYGSILSRSHSRPPATYLLADDVVDWYVKSHGEAETAALVQVFFGDDEERKRNKCKDIVSQMLRDN